MLDIKFIRENPEKVKEAAKSKRIDLDIAKIIEVDKDYRELQTAVQKIQEQQNTLSKSIKAKPTGRMCPLCGSLMMAGTKTIPERCSKKECPNHNPHKRK